MLVYIEMLLSRYILVSFWSRWFWNQKGLAKAWQDR